MPFQGKNIMEFVSIFECPLTKSTSSLSFGNGMDIEISQKDKNMKKILLRIAHRFMTLQYQIKHNTRKFYTYIQI